VTATAPTQSAAAVSTQSAGAIRRLPAQGGAAEARALRGIRQRCRCVSVIAPRHVDDLVLMRMLCMCCAQNRVVVTARTAAIRLMC